VLIEIHFSCLRSRLATSSSRIVPTLHKVTTLSLSRNQAIKADLLANILAKYPKLQKLQLFDTLQIPLHIKFDLVRGINIKGTPWFRTSGSPNDQLRRSSLNCICPSVIQMPFISHQFGTEADHDAGRLSDGSLDFQSIFSNDRRYGTLSHTFPFAHVNRTRTAFMGILVSFLDLSFPLWGVRENPKRYEGMRKAGDRVLAAIARL
jgi:hypothetical protein